MDLDQGHRVIWSFLRDHFENEIRIFGAIGKNPDCLPDLIP